MEVAVTALLFTGYFIAFFSPALLHDRLLAPGDGLIYYYPALLSKAVLWRHDLFAGHPSFGDSQALVFSPMRVFGAHYNAAVIAIYVIASTSAYCLVRLLTGMRAAGAIAGLVYGSGGAMIAHLGHLTIIYSAAWTPLILWAVARARDTGFPWAIGIGAGAIAASTLGGHPQIFSYGVAMGGLYALYSIASPGIRRRGSLAAAYAVMFGCGIAIACIQVIPLVELGAWSLRNQMSFDEFTSYALGPKDLLLFFFPSIFGSYPGFGVPYFGSWNLTELATYAGASTLLLALAAWSARWRERQLWFWAAALVLGVVYALGKTTPLADIAFRVPGLNQFRVPARTAFETTLALAVLAGFGVRAIAERRVTGVRMRRFWFRTALLFGLPLLALMASYPMLVAAAGARGIAMPPRLYNPAIAHGLLAMVTSAGIVFWLLRRPGPRAAYALMVVLTIDLGAFGWYYEWNSPSQGRAERSKPWQEFANEVRDAHGRVLLLDTSGVIPVTPNLNTLYNLPSANGYGPLILQHYAAAMGMESTGVVASLDNLHQRLALTGSTWLVAGDGLDRGFYLGGDCSARTGPTESTATLPKAVRATHLEILSHMQCSVAVPQDAPVLAVSADTLQGGTESVVLRAGSDTGEWAIDRPDVAPIISHLRPPHFETFPAGNFSGHSYRAKIPLHEGGAPAEISRLKLRWLLPAGPGIELRSIELVDATTGKRHRVRADDLIWGTQLRAVDEMQLPGARWVRRVEEVRDPAWLVGDVEALSDEQALEAIRRGRLPDGRPFDPYRVAMVERGARKRVSDTSGAPPGKVTIEEWRDGLLRMDVDVLDSAFLVIAESYYPGWEAHVDGQEVPIVRTNVAFQGISVPAGKHQVVFSFSPLSLKLGFTAATFGLGILFAYLARARRALRRSPPLAPEPSTTNLVLRVRSW